MIKVYISQGSNAYRRMFEQRGHEVVDQIEDATLVQFCGGADVDPSLYGGEDHPFQSTSAVCDVIDTDAFLKALALDIPMAGICRGGQFLNVSCGGSMYQHVDNHGIAGVHNAVDYETGGMYHVTSTHHQMMRPGFQSGAQLIGGCPQSRTTRKEIVISGEVVNVDAMAPDVEVVYYPKGKGVLCFQPHPEIVHQEHLCQEWYFKLLERKLNVA